MKRLPFSFGIGAVLAVLVGLGVLVATPRARAHGDEPHGTEAAPAAASTSTDGLISVPQEAQFALGIRTERADSQAVAEILRVPGVLAPGSGGEAVVSSAQPGRFVAARLPGVGETVRAGQVVGTVEGAVAGPEVASIRAEIARAESEVAQARADVVRLRALARVVARKEIEAAEIRLRGAEAQRAALGGALGAGNRYPVVAPVSGMVAEVGAAPGSFVEAGTPILRLVSLGRLQVRARVPEADIGRVQGASAPARVVADAFPDAAFEARFQGFGPVVDPTSRTLDALYALGNPAGRLRSGQSVTVEIPVSANVPSVTVPEAAVVRGENGQTIVFVHPTAEGFEERSVTLGPAAPGGRVAVVSGLRVGERVVVAGATALRNL